MSSFIDTFEFTVDAKGRFSIPAPLREGLAASAEKTFIVSRGPEGCLEGYPLDEWARRVRVLRSIPNKRLGRYYKRLILGNAKRCKMDSHHRILIPPDLLRSVGISRNVLILGQLDHLEFWAPDAHKAYIDAQQIPLEDALEELETQLREERLRRPEGEW
ncbi:MAG: division/cell wall cluster transcriptional repressor MraZ [Candidatus Eisenbacteria bacterium]